jgi:molybdate transport system ATP-binding protein
LHIPQVLGDILMVLIALRKVGLELNQVVLLENINLEIVKGSVLHLLGDNGSGKSTLLKLLYGQLWHSSGTRTYYFTNPPRSSPIGAKEQMALVSPELQERYQRLNHDRSALEVLQTGFAQTDFLYSPLEPREQAMVLGFAARFGITGLLEQPFNKLSKGQMRQVLLTRALLLEPKILLLDEFFSGIDTTAKNRLRSIVSQYLESGGTLIYTTHRIEEAFVSHEQKFFLEDKTLRQKRAIKSLIKPNAKQIQEAQSLEVLIELINTNVYLNEPKDDATAPDGHALSSSKLVLENISFALFRHQHWFITGHNGAGKSTFARLLRGDVSPAFGGLVRWFGSAFIPIWQRQQQIALVSSDMQAWHRVDATGFEIIASGFFGAIGWHHPLTPVQTARVEKLLLQLKIGALANRNALYLSQGELRKLLLARAFVTNPEVIILDEAFDYLDGSSRDLIWSVLEQLNATLIVIAHRAEDKPPFATKHLILEQGRVLFSGS